ncbi:MAG: hypothetical protein AAGI53_08210 [Planctomycetota bacterium]
MKNVNVSALALAAAAGLAVAQPTVDGVFDAGSEASFYGDILWTNPNPTSFGDNPAGGFIAGDPGDPDAVTTGAEIQIPLSALGNPGSITLAGWINSGDRTFMSNQIIHDGTLPANTGNIGNGPDFEGDASRFSGDQFVNVTIPGAGTAPTLDGTRDASYTDVFVQTNFTGFGNETDGTVDGTGPNGGGSEIDRVSVASDGTNLYIFVGGNVEVNGNGLDLYIGSPNLASDVTDLSTAGAGGDGGFVVNGINAVMDSAAPVDYVISVFDENGDGDGGTADGIGMYAGPVDDDVDLVITAGAYGASNTAAGFGVSVDNSNTAGVPGSPIGTTPVSPAANFAYGSELNNLRGQVIASEVGENFLHLFLGANLNVGFEKCVFLIDVAPGGQNELREDNVDISFGGLNTHGGLLLDAGFEADYWFNINNGLDGGTTVINFMDAAVLRTNGPEIDLFTGVILDYGAFSGGSVASFDGTPTADPNEVIDFSGPRIDIQDGTLAGLFTEFAPRNAQLDPANPIPALIMGAIDNSNVGGVTDTTADAAAADAVSTGVELMLDLDELGWDGESEVKVMAWIASGDFNVVSNQGLGFPAGSDNLSGDPTPDMPDSGDETGVGDIDFSMIPGDQFIVIPVGGGDPGCNLADLAAPFGVLDLSDIDAFIIAFLASDSAADIAAPFGVVDLSDIDTFIIDFLGGCP